VLQELGEVGIDYDDVVELLEVEAVDKFETSWKELLESVAGELKRLAKEAGQ
jgi:transaldolase